MKRSGKSLRSSDSTLPSREVPLPPSVRRFIRRVQNTVKKFDLWQKGDAFIVGVSGGADSLCLLDVLYLLSQKHHFRLHIAHMNYHLRGRASDLDEVLVKKTAARYHLPCSVLSKRQRSKTVSEEKLRDIRYAFFEKLRRETGSHSIVIAHNQDDQAETLLLRLLRGAGLAGLAAMRPKSGSVIRPLIEMSRADIISYLKDRRITFREDESNALPQYARNRIRHELIPFLEKKFQPQARKLLAETAFLLGDDYAFLEKHPADISLKRDALAAEFSADALLKLPLPLLRRELRAVLRDMLAGKNPEKNLINELIKALKSGKNKTQTIIFKGLKFIRKGDTVRLLRF